MSSNIQPSQVIFRDGTSQQDRLSEALQPQNILVEDRSMETLIKEAQRLAKEICFFDEQHNAAGNWEAFLVGDGNRYKNETPAQQEVMRKQWAQQLAAYVQNPALFQNDAEKLGQLSRPHVVLFLTFLQLLNYIKSQLNGLTQKHLDFYFLERLQLTPKAAVPDVVNILVELAENIEQLEIKEGTVLLAGKDEEGNELHYTTDYDTVISQAAIEQLKTVFVEKVTLTIAGAHQQNVNDLDKGFTKMMEMALGNPLPADPLPPLPAGVSDLVALSVGLEDDETKQAYVEEQLFLTLNDFQFIIQVHVNDLDSTKHVTAATWQEVYNLLDKAYKNKISQQRQLVLKTIREANAATGFDDLIRHVYGHPEPGGALPLYRGGSASLAIVYDDLLADIAADQQEAAAYITKELFLTENNFVRLMQVGGNAESQPGDWDEVYSMLELAERKVRSQPLPSPYKEELIDIYAEDNALASAFSVSGEKDESLRFKTFGGYALGTNRPLTPATLGFAISSPLLQLQEGERQITCFISMDAQSEGMEEVKALFSDSSKTTFSPIQVFLTMGAGWVQQGNTEITFGDYLVARPMGEYTATINQHTVNITAGDEFTYEDMGRCLVWTDGTIYRITDIDAPNQVRVQQEGTTASQATVLKYDPAAVYLNTLQVVVTLLETDDPVTPVAVASEGMLATGFPAMALVLNHIEEQGKYHSNYQQLLHLKIEKVFLQANVQGLKNITLQYDDAALDAKKPFDPFGPAPETGTSLYLAHNELAQKRLDSLVFDFQWNKAPAAFSDYYKNYWLVQSGNINLSAAEYTIKDNSDFKARVFLTDRRVEWELPEINLFTEPAGIENIPAYMQALAGTDAYKQNVQSQTGEEEVLDWERYVRLELSGVDFQHSIYNSLLAKQAVSGDAAIKELLLNPPYNPRLKKLRVAYSAHTELYPGKTTDAADQLYHLHPFGVAPVAAAANFLSNYSEEGTLYLGINKLILPQTLSILFQMAEGSADPDVEKPPLTWSYLQSDQWVTFPGPDIISDTTNELLNTGIVRLNIPVTATNNNTVMPGGLHWIKVSCDSHSTALPDAINIMAQGLSASFASEVVATSHYNKLLPAGTITETQEPNAQIRKIDQPYTSSKGKPAEKDTAFYNRISERLRHKNRAITMWDYERIVLDHFTEVYKVKCLPAIEQNNAMLGWVNVMVIPDIRGQLPFDPFQPKVPADTLANIQAHLESVAPAYADIAVKNPSYLQVKIRCVVKFKPGYNEGFYKPKLIDALKRFLSPWAYGESNDITIGGTIYAGVIINFIAEQPYIDFVANMKLFQSEDGVEYTDARVLNEGKNQVAAYRPDMALVSATTHEIDVVDENGYEQDHYEGINYMKVELDFLVGQDAVTR